MQSDPQGRVSLYDYLNDSNHRLARKQVTKWAIEFCLGMEYANNHGLKSHGDVKPSNILVSAHGDLKIADFGLARAGQTCWPVSGCSLGRELDPAARQRAAHLWSYESRRIAGTYGYIAPEVLQGEPADIRSDIFSFGVVLYQMVTHCSMSPFVQNGNLSLSDSAGDNPNHTSFDCVPKVNGSLGLIIEKCLQPDPAARFGSFAELRKAVEAIHRPRLIASCPPVTPIIGPDELMAKGTSLLTLERPDQAAECFREAIRLAPSHAPAWVGLAEAALRIGRREEARRLINRAIRFNLRSGAAWRAKGLLHEKCGFLRVALRCYQKAVALDPEDNRAWLAMSLVLLRLGLPDEGRKCLEATLAKDLKNPAAWEYLGLFQAAQGQFLEAIESYKFALIIDPQCETALVNKGIALDGLRLHPQAIAAYDDALKINPRSTAALTNQAMSLAVLGYVSSGIAGCDRALQLQGALGHAWQVKGLCLVQLGRNDDALDCLIRATKLEPGEASAWLSRGDAEASLGMFDEAENSWLRAIGADGARDRKLSEKVQQRLGQLREWRLNGVRPMPSGSPTNQLVWRPAEPKIRPPLPRARVATHDSFDRR